MGHKRWVTQANWTLVFWPDWLTRVERTHFMINHVLQSQVDVFSFPVPNTTHDFCYPWFSKPFHRLWPAVILDHLSYATRYPWFLWPWFLALRYPIERWYIYWQRTHLFWLEARRGQQLASDKKTMATHRIYHVEYPGSWNNKTGMWGWPHIYTRVDSPVPNHQQFNIIFFFHNLLQQVAMVNPRGLWFRREMIAPSYPRKGLAPMRASKGDRNSFENHEFHQQKPWDHCQWVPDCTSLLT
jgi:hypothetical protein